MTLFLLGALALTAAATALIAPALRGRRARDLDDRDRRAEQNIRVARRRLRELHDAGAADDAARGEIELALLDDLGDSDGGEKPAPAKTPSRAVTALILAAIPLAAAAIYLALGNPDSLLPPSPTAATAAPPSMPEMIRRLEGVLAADPDNAGHWALAARAYMAARRFADAERAYQTLHALVGDEPEVLSAWADAAVMAAGGAFSAAVRARLARALELAPRNKNALWLAALGAEAGGDYAQAQTHLQRLLALVADDPQDRAEVRGMLERVRQAAGAADGTEPAENSAAATGTESAENPATEATTAE